MPCGATQDRWVMVERSDRMWSTGEGNGKPLQYSCLSPKRRGSLRFLHPLEVRPSSIVPYLVESREAPPNSTVSYCSWGSQGKNTEVVCHSLLQWTTFCQTSPPCPARLWWPHRVKVKSESEVAQSCPTLCSPWTAARRAPLSTQL